MVAHVHTHTSLVALLVVDGVGVGDTALGVSVALSLIVRLLVALTLVLAVTLALAVSDGLLDALAAMLVDAVALIDDVMDLLSLMDALMLGLAVLDPLKLGLAVIDTLAVTLIDDVSDGDAVSDPRLGVADGVADGTTTYSSRRSNSTSVDVSVAWCTSTAMTLSPTTSTPLGMTMLSTTRACAAVVPVNALSARVAAVTAAGAAAMLRRPTSTPLTYTTAPSATRAMTHTHDSEPTRDIVLLCDALHAPSHMMPTRAPSTSSADSCVDDTETRLRK
jgi:hypothetical protein